MGDYSQYTFNPALQSALGPNYSNVDSYFMQPQQPNQSPPQFAYQGPFITVDGSPDRKIKSINIGSTTHFYKLQMIGDHLAAQTCVAASELDEPVCGEAVYLNLSENTPQKQCPQQENWIHWWLISGLSALALALILVLVLILIIMRRQK